MRCAAVEEEHLATFRAAFSVHNRTVSGARQDYAEVDGYVVAASYRA